jgi:hypothetical protein
MLSYIKRKLKKRLATELKRRASKNKICKVRVEKYIGEGGQRGASSSL